MLKVMVKSVAVLGVAGLVLTGCATKQDDLVQRLTELEGKVSQIEQMHQEEHPKILSKINDLETQIANIQADHEELKEKINVVDEKTEQNAAAIRGLVERVDNIEARLDRLSVNLERVMGKSLSK